MASIPRAKVAVAAASVLVAGVLLVCWTNGRARKSVAKERHPVVSGDQPRSSTQMPSVRGTVSYVVRTEGTPTQTVRERIAAAGARIVGVMPPNGLLVESDAAARAQLEAESAVTNILEWTPSRKVSKRLAAKLASGVRQVDVTVVPLAAEDVPRVAAFIQAEGGTLIEGRQGGGRVRATLPCAAVARLAARGDVRRIEPFVAPHLLNDMATDVMGVREVWNTRGLTGRGQIIVTSDTGVDTGNTRTLMADFSGRICKIRMADMSKCIAADKNGHGTHTAGSIVGTGALSDGQIRGMAYEARLWVWACCPRDEAEAQKGVLYLPEDCDQLFAPDSRNYPSFIHSASWGGDENTYSSLSVEIDTYLWENPETLAVFAAGNSGVVGINEPGGAKNVLAVGATQNSRVGSYGWPSGNPAMIAGYSSRGPMPDGRIKPDICAPGSGILSTRTTMRAETDLGFGAYSNTNYTFMCGTSMATPLVAGAAALVRQWLVERRGYAFRPPTAALMKAILLGGTHDMSADAGASCGGAAPNGVQGWGRIDLEETLYPSNRSVRLIDRIPFAHGETYVYRVATTNAAPLDVQLVWTDYPGVESDDKTPVLVNDLDLSVSNETTGVVWWGNGVVGGDRTNNVEGVRIASAEPAIYTVRVTGHAVPYGYTEGGAAALYLRGTFREGLTITFR